MNITLPETLAKRIEKATDNKSAFIARAVKELLENMRKNDFQRRLEEGYREMAKHPEWQKDERDDW
jgi:metal-responsive CopG/Arc/MetJ family transcriptional regulator